MIAAPRDGDDLRKMLAGATDGAFVGGENRRIVLWNRAATSIMGYTATEALGRACCELFDGRDGGGPWHDPASVMMLAETPVRAFDVCTTTKAGRPLWLHLTLFPVQVRKGGALVVHLFRDVTRTRELVARVRERAAAPTNGAAARRLGHGPLTHRELEVLRLTAQGLNTMAIAERLHISRATARNHAQNILWKLEVHNRLQAVAYAARHGLL
jgi:PAS domain S-box-containing protein